MKSLQKVILTYGSTQYNWELNNVDDLKAHYEKHKEEIAEYAKSQVPSFLNRWVEWDKFKNTYDRMTDIIIDECGEGVLKEFQAIKKTKELKGETIEDDFIEMIKGIYGSLDNYEAYGKSIQRCSTELGKMLEDVKFGLIEKVYTKGYFTQSVYILEGAGKDIISACGEIKAKKE